MDPKNLRVETVNDFRLLVIPTGKTIEETEGGRGCGREGRKGFELQKMRMENLRKSKWVSTTRNVTHFQ